MKRELLIFSLKEGIIYSFLGMLFSIVATQSFKNISIMIIAIPILGVLISFIFTYLRNIQKHENLIRLYGDLYIEKFQEVYNEKGLKTIVREKWLDKLEVNLKEFE
ncbi:hypothetical protein [Pseudemcibacter aquimaris]|uniref:hypothetical protein n=1 Tax=Pseudemcibacter aquimaris TaxID=2857064 RepID=UPI0020124487|nr:hypothetical protein [Pseudemcibacter aquimaris]MCC3862367.1 hypothetical protein [Pseudemcibacter aquimaris]WDU59202.1 hypothetical protein KW060_02830 [Pseudemcibacter aquimaris]